MTFQDLISALSNYWASKGCLIHQPLDLEIGAGTMHPETFLRVLGSSPWRVAYVQPSRRPADGRFGENPNRLFKHHQFQVLLKPSPDRSQQLFLESLEACGINCASHDVRFEVSTGNVSVLRDDGSAIHTWVKGVGEVITVPTSGSAIHT